MQVTDHHRAINRLSESGVPMTIAQSKSLFPTLDIAPVSYQFSVSPSLVLRLQLDGRLLVVTHIVASQEEGFYFGNHNGRRLGFEGRHVFGEGMPPREVREFKSHHTAEVHRLSAQNYGSATIASMLHLDQAEVEETLGGPHRAPAK